MLLPKGDRKYTIHIICNDTCMYFAMKFESVFIHSPRSGMCICMSMYICVYARAYLCLCMLVHFDLYALFLRAHIHKYMLNVFPFMVLEFIWMFLNFF